MVMMTTVEPATRVSTGSRTTDRMRVRANRNRMPAGRNAGPVPNGRPLPGASMPAAGAAEFVARQLQPSGE